MEPGIDVVADHKSHRGIAQVADSIEHDHMRLRKDHSGFNRADDSEIVQFRESNVDGRTSFDRKPAPLLPEF